MTVGLGNGEGLCAVSAYLPRDRRALDGARAHRVHTPTTGRVLCVCGVRGGEYWPGYVSDSLVTVHRTMA
jgi:hypothetical protein